MLVFEQVRAAECAQWLDQAEADVRAPDGERRYRSHEPCEFLAQPTSRPRHQAAASQASTSRDEEVSNKCVLDFVAPVIKIEFVR